MRFNRKALEVFVLLCLVVATTTVSGSRLWAHVGEATAASVLILFSLLGFRHYGRRAN